MKSTGEAIGYDDSLTRALYKALQASGMNVANYGTIFVTIADSDKEEALPLIRRFYDLGFNIEATRGHRRVPQEPTASAPASSKKISEGSEEILDSIRQGYVSYVINTRDISSTGPAVSDGYADSPLRRGKQRHHVHRAGHGAGAAGRAGGDHAGHFHHRLDKGGRDNKAVL